MGANTTAKANNDLLSLTTSVVDTGASITNEDPFIAGIKVPTHPAVDANTKAWGPDSTRVKIVLRQGTEMWRFDVLRQDAIDVRGIARVGFAFLHPLPVVRLYDAP